MSARDIPAPVVKALRDIHSDIPEARGTVLGPVNRVRLTDILMEVMGAGEIARKPTIEEATATLMEAGFHVTAKPVPTLPARRELGTRTAPHPDRVLGSVNPDSLSGRLLAAYFRHPSGLSDEQAAKVAGVLRNGYWKRCSELRSAGLIQPLEDEHGDYIEARSDSGILSVVCAITPEGSAIAREFV
jgi:hypothetical protein